MTKRKSYAPHRINWVDIETTGLDVEVCPILEVAHVITDSKYRILCQNEWTVKHDPNKLMLTRFAWETHQKLLARCFYESSFDLETISFNMIAAMEKHGAVGAPMGGNSIGGFDRPYFKRYLPEVERKMHYRNFDTSTLLMFADSHGIKLDIGGSPPHRAMDDILASIEIARKLKEAMQ